MRAIELRVSAADLADVLSAMREWLDHNRCNLDLFRYEMNGASHAIVHAHFVEDDQAEVFRATFAASS